MKPTLTAEEKRRVEDCRGHRWIKSTYDNLDSTPVKIYECAQLDAELRRCPARFVAPYYERMDE